MSFGERRDARDQHEARLPAHDRAPDDDTWAVEPGFAAQRTPERESARHDLLRVRDRLVTSTRECRRAREADPSHTNRPL